MKPNSELRTQAQHDAIEQRGMKCRDGGLQSQRNSDASDEFQFLLWERKIYVDVVGYDQERRTCDLVGSVTACWDAVQVLKPMGVRVLKTRTE